MYPTHRFREAHSVFVRPGAKVIPGNQALLSDFARLRFADQADTRFAGAGSGILNRGLICTSMPLEKDLRGETASRTGLDLSQIHIDL